MELLTGDNDDGRRLDRILRKALADHPLPLIHRLLRQGHVFVNGKPARAQDRIKSGTKISIPSLKDTPLINPLQKGRKPQSGTIEVLWEGSGLLAVNKPCGLAVHGRNSLDDMVYSFLADRLSPSLSFKPGPLHRLDKPSSGIVIFSTNINGARLFTSLMHEQKVQKLYLAVVEGCLEKETLWQDSLIRDNDKKKTFVSQEQSNKSKNAITKVIPLNTDGKRTLIQAEIITGRTHQIRAQAASHGYPLFGDTKYGAKGINNTKKANFFLHAWKLEFLEYSITAPLPQTWSPMASLIASTSVFLSGSLPEKPGISTSKG